MDRVGLELSLPGREPWQADLGQSDGIDLHAQYYGERTGGDLFDAVRVGPRVAFLLSDIAGRRPEVDPISAEMQEAFRQKANAETLHGALEKLPDEFREIIVLHDLEGLAYKEIAAVMGIPIGTVMSRLARARGRLRTEIIASKARESSL